MQAQVQVQAQVDEESDYLTGSSPKEPPEVLAHQVVCLSSGLPMFHKSFFFILPDRLCWKSLKTCRNAKKKFLFVCLFVTCEKKFFFASMLVCLFVQTFVCLFVCLLQFSCG